MFMLACLTRLSEKTQVQLCSEALLVQSVDKMQVQDIDLTMEVVRIFGKGSKERIVPIGEYTMESLMNYLEIRNELLRKRTCEYLFLNNLGGRLSRFSFFKTIVNGKRN